MKADIAEQLLARILEWNNEKLAEERYKIQMFADIKYDRYQKYSQGMKYVENLALWLRCFENEDRQMMYDFLEENLIYISEKQMRTLVEMSYPFYIKPILLSETMEICRTNKIENHEEQKEKFDMLVKQSLFLGLSDGSHIDLFRRANPHLSNEQINVFYDMSQNKFKDMVQEIPSTRDKEEKLKNIFLLEDFSGSGISFIRKENNQWKGKIVKFLERIKSYGADISKINLTLVLYISTVEAVKYIESQLLEYRKENGIIATYTVEAIQMIHKQEIKPEIQELLKKYFDKYNMNSIVDIHYKKGNSELPFLGFNECALPLVIYHNTPNNSLPIIWFHNNKKYYAIFPRVTRHKEN